VATPIEPKPVEPQPAEVVAELEEIATEAATAKTASSEATAPGPPKTADQSGTDGKAGTGARTANGTIESRSGGGNPGAVVDYDARLNAWLQKHQEYPRRAKLRRQEGVATLYFVIDRGGHVLDFRVEKGTGYKLLDEEVINMVKRASPMPAPPESITGETLEYRIPVVFDQH
jgi:protein TonB